MILKNFDAALALALVLNLMASVDPAKRQTTASVRNDFMIVVEWLVVCFG
jgi:hypothetical protein